MSRSGYSDDCDDNLAHGRWRGRVASAIRGKRGQKLFTELAEALDAMPVKELFTEELKTETGGFCTLGVVGQKRGIAIDKIDPQDSELVADSFDIAEPLAREIVYLNDEECAHMTPTDRWSYMRKWVGQQIKNVESKQP